MTAALPLFLLTYLRRRSGEPWRTAAGLAAGLLLVIAVVLEQGLGLRVYPGVAGAWLGALAP
jgi:hypothetical protein